MKLSIGFIAHKLKEFYDVAEVNPQEDGPHFETARIYSPAQAKRLEAEAEQPLFIVDGSYAIGNEKLGGMIWLGDERPCEDIPSIWIRETQNALEVLDCVLDILEKHSTWCEEVHEALLRQTPIVEVAQMLERVTNNPFWYSDSALRTLFISHDEDLSQRSYKWRYQTQTGRYPSEVLSQIVSGGDLERINANRHAWLFDDSESYYIPFVSKAIVCNGTIDGYLFIIESAEDSSYCDIELLEMFGNLIASYIEHSRVVTPTSNRFVDQILKECLTGSLSNPIELDEVAGLLRWGADDQFIVTVFDTKHDNSTGKGTLESRMRMLEYNLAGHAIAIESNVVFIANVSESKGADIEATLSTFCSRFDWKAGTSNAFGGLSRIDEGYLQAKIALRLGSGSDGEGCVFPFRDYAVAYICEQLSRKISPQLLIHQDVRRLASYDEETNSNLLETLDAYLANERSVSKTASSLFLHRNSVAYRIDKMRSLMHTSLDDDDNRLNIILSLKIWQFTHRQDG